MGFMWQKAEWNGAPIEEIVVDNREEWLTIRNNLDGIGGSECGTVLGLDSYKSRIRLFYQKIGLSPSNYSDNIYAFMGRLLEDKIVELYEHYDENEEVMLFNHNNGIKTRQVEIRKNIMRNPQYPGLFMNVDGRVAHHPNHAPGGILECKMVSGQVAAKWKLGFPVKYVAQAQHYMFLPNTDWAELAQITDGVKFNVTFIPKNPLLQEKILEAIYDFQERVKKAREIIQNTASREKQLQYVTAVEPPYEEVFDYKEFMSEKHIQRTEMGTAEASPEIIDLIERLQQTKDRIKVLQAHEIKLTNQVMKDMEDNGLKEYTWENGYVRWLKRFTIKMK